MSSCCDPCEITCDPCEITVESQPIVVEVIDGGTIVINNGGSYYDLTVISNNQSTFDLPYAIPNPDKSRLYLNGQKLVYGVDYSINASVLNYSGVPLETSDYFEIYW